MSRFVSGLLLLGMLTGACFLPLEVKAAEDVKLLKEQKTERFIPLKLQEADLSMVEELDFDEIEQSVDEILGGEFQFENTVMELLSGEQPFTLEGFVAAVVEQLQNNWRTEKHLLLSILLLGIAAALMSNFSNIFQNQQIAEVSFEITYLLLFLILLQIFSGAMEITREVLLGIQDFMNVLVPAFCLAVTMASGSTTALVFYEFFLGLIYFIQRLIQNGLMALIQVHVILVFVNHLTKEEYLSQMKEMASKVTVWLLKSMLAVVIGFNTIQGILNPAVDSLKTTLFSRAAEMIPGIGNIAGSVTDVVLGSSVLIKNGIGVAALVVIVLICLMPLVKLGVLMMLLELAAALLQPVSDKRMTGCVAGVGEGIRLLFRVVFTTAVLFMLTIAVVTVSVRG
ncbi:MAG: stage III sporulation protein AF [Lachnospiraceae bacterium]|nr:stage III sporulation protein AF [Lachnospiraceae bacterium]